jgi:type II pantothenate kinase
MVNRFINFPRENSESATKRFEPGMIQQIHVGLDIGGTLAKVVAVGPYSILSGVAKRHSASVITHDKFSDDDHDISASDLGFISTGPSFEPVVLKMFLFDSRYIRSLLSFLQELSAALSPADELNIRVTGGGAVKFRSDLLTALPKARFSKVDEIDAIANGFSFLVQRENSAFIFNSVDSSWTPVPHHEVKTPFPLLLVNIGSGVSMIKIEAPTIYKRVQGSAIGGGTVLGLGRAMFNAKSFEEIMDLSQQGNSSNVDLSVGELIGAPPDDEFWSFDTLAASLTKLNTLEKQQISRADLAQSIVRMVSYNIGYIAYLVSCIHDCSRIYFSGKYVNKHVPTMDAILFAVEFYQNWKAPPSAEESVDLTCDVDVRSIDPTPEKKRDVRFLHQEGYVGAIGALIARKFLVF